MMPRRAQIFNARSAARHVKYVFTKKMHYKIEAQTANANTRESGFPHRNSAIRRNEICAEYQLCEFQFLRKSKLALLISSDEAQSAICTLREVFDHRESVTRNSQQNFNAHKCVTRQI